MSCLPGKYMLDNANSPVKATIDINIKKDSTHTVALEITNQFYPGIND